MNKQDELRIRLDLIIPMNFFISKEWKLMFGVDSEIAIGKVVESNPNWVEEVLEGDYNLSDVLHDFKGIYAEDEHFVPRISTKVSDEKVNGYTNIQTYRLCLVLDNQHFVDNPLKTFLELLEENEFEGNDIDVINWNEVMQRYSDNILTEHTFRGILKRWE